jgi:hypothetical protein
LVDRRNDQIDQYVTALRRALERRGLSDERIVSEVREHLVDAAARARTDGVADTDAVRQAIERFGSPDAIARSFATNRARGVEIWLLAAALAIGAAIAYVDSRPTWDDTGITAGTLVLSAAALSCVAQRRAWLIAIAIGIWIPILAIIRRPDWHDALMFLVLLFPLTGALIGRGLRSLISPSSSNSHRVA